MSTIRLTFVALNVLDLEASLAFYRDIIGIPLERASHDSELNDPWYGGDHAALSWTDGKFLHFAIYPVKEPHRPQTRSVQVGFHVADFDTVHQRAVTAGVEVVQTPREEPWGMTARYLDPDRNIISVTKV